VRDDCACPLPLFSRRLKTKGTTRHPCSSSTTGPTNIECHPTAEILPCFHGHTPLQSL
jgi:hypothetical protein